MPRGYKNAPQPVAQSQPAAYQQAELVPGTQQPLQQQGQTPQLTGPKKGAIDRRLRRSNINHIFYFDITGNGVSKEIAVVKLDKNPDGSIRSLYYIDVALLDTVDRGRIKAMVTSVHANKYPLWDLMSMTTLNNGLNALDYFHQLVRTEQGPGHVNTAMGGSIAGAVAEGTTMVGSQFSDPKGGTLDPTGVA